MNVSLQEIANLSNDSLKVGRAQVAKEVLGVLRTLRNEHHREWDALMEAEGEMLCNLWDYLKEAENNENDE